MESWGRTSGCRGRGEPRRRARGVSPYDAYPTSKGSSCNLRFPGAVVVDMVGPSAPGRFVERRHKHFRESWRSYVLGWITVIPLYAFWNARRANPALQGTRDEAARP